LPAGEKKRTALENKRAHKEKGDEEEKELRLRRKLGRFEMILLKEGK